MVQEAAPPSREPARVEPDPSPSVPLPADARLQPWIAGDYGGFDETSLPHGEVVLPATLVTSLAVKVRDSPFPPVLAIGPDGTYTRIEGPWTPAIHVYLTPLGAYKLHAFLLDRARVRIAAESGYADQSHLIREFRRFTGTTPGALATD